MLTVRQVHAAGDGNLADGGGLTLKVRGEGASWLFRYTATTGRRRELGLGVAHRGSLAQTGASLVAARKAAAKARDLLAAGVDPIEHKAATRQRAVAAEQQRKAERQREQRTLARCARDYHERVIEPQRTTKHSAQWISSLENHVPAELWNAPIDGITAPELLRALVAIKPHERARHLTDERLRETVGRVRQRLDAIFEDAIFHGYAKANPAAACKRKLAETMGARKRAAGFAALPYREAPAFMARLREQPGIAARALELAMLCAARTGEVLGMEWAEVDLDAQRWIVPAERMKGGEAHTVYLVPRALAILQEQRRLGSAWIFPSVMQRDGADAALSNMAMLTLLGRMGMRDATTVHGLCRSTFSTWANDTAAARSDVIEACLAHREGDKVRASYNRATFDAERRALLAAWSEYLQGAVVIEFPARATA